MGIKRMRLDLYKLGKDGKHYSSLDNDILTNIANCKQHVGYNCDILIFQMMIMRRKRDIGHL